MLEKGRNYTVKITDISSDGNGVGAVDGFTVFVPNTAIGDTAVITAEKVKSRYAVARVTELTELSEDREDAQCKAFGACGGCQLLHINYDAQKKAKEHWIEAALQRIGGFKDFKCDEFLYPKEPYRYRNKCIYQIGKNEEGKLVSGFFAAKTHSIIPIEDCLISPEINSRINRALLAYMRENSVSVYDERSCRGTVKGLFIRHAETTGEIMVVVYTGKGRLTETEKLIKHLTEATDKIVSVYVNDSKNGNKLIFGQPVICDTLCGTEFKISPNSFYQINPYMTGTLYEKALEYAEIDKDDNVLDVYCGIGTISLAAAKRAHYVTGIEIVEQAVINAKENAESNGIANADFYADSAENAVPRLINDGFKPDVVILDPPRKGSDERTLGAILSAEPDRIVYVSCNPATLARDARYIAAHGYRLEKCAGVDMFPGTAHVETVVLMSRKE